MSNKLSTKIESLYLCPGVYILLKWAFSLIWLLFLTDEIPLFLCVCVIKFLYSIKPLLIHLAKINHFQFWVFRRISVCLFQSHHFALHIAFIIVYGTFCQNSLNPFCRQYIRWHFTHFSFSAYNLWSRRVGILNITIHMTINWGLTNFINFSKSYNGQV